MIMRQRTVKTKEVFSRVIIKMSKQVHEDYVNFAEGNTELTA